MTHRARCTPLPRLVLAAIGAILLWLAAPALEAQAPLLPVPTIGAASGTDGVPMTWSPADAWKDAAPANQHLSARLDVARGARNGAWLGGIAGLVVGGMYYMGLSNALGVDAWYLLVVGPLVGAAAGAAMGGIVGLIIEETG
jgi:hypothetical protein